MNLQSVPLPDDSGHDIDPKSFAFLSRLVREEAGIVLNDSKKSLVVSRLAKRLRDLGMDTFAEYCDHLGGHGGRDEVQNLISLMTTNVTRFFREGHHFAALRNDILPGLIDRARHGGSVRIWSAGCSSGQEPYSIAISVLELEPNIARFDLRILATDIDLAMVDKGRKGEYPASSAEDIPEKTLKTHFRQDASSPGMIRMVDEVRSLVTFAPLNLLHDWPMKGRFDVIFCRNTVIYFDGETQSALWARFADQLNPGGHLFVGHSERVAGPAQAKFTANGITQYQLRSA